MQIEMTTEQFKKKVFAIRDKYLSMRNKHNKLMGYLESIEEDVNKKVSDFNHKLMIGLEDKYSTLTDEVIKDTFFIEKSYTTYEEKGYLWWKKKESISKPCFELNYCLDENTELNVVEACNWMRKELGKDGVLVLKEIPLPSNCGRDLTYMVYVNPLDKICKKLEVHNVVATKLSSVVENWLQQINFLEENGIRKVELSGEEVELLSKEGTELIEKPKQQYVCSHLGRWGWGSFNLSNVIDTLSKVYNKPKEQIKQELDNL